MSTVLVLVITTIIAFFINRYYKNRRFYELVKKLPSPPGSFFLGHAKIFKQLDGLKEQMTDVLNEYNGMALLRFGPTSNILSVADHKLAELLVTSKHVEKSPRYRLFSKWLGFGIFTGEGQTWKKHRALVTPAFHFEILKEFVGTFNAVSDKFVTHLAKEIDKEIDIYNYVNLCALDIITETAMGVPVNAQTNSESQYVQSVHEMLRIIATRAFSTLKIHDWIFRLSKDYDKEKKALKVLKGFTNAVIEKKQTELNNGTANQANTGSEKKPRLAYLDLVLKNRGSNFTDEEVGESVQAFMFAGHDTGGLVISCTLYLLAQHPDVQQLAFEELRELYGDDRTSPSTYKDLQEMKYLEMVIKESMRLYPAGIYISKLLKEDLHYNEYTLPKGLIAMVFIHTLHRREKYFPDPDKFDPERFAPGNQSNIVPFSYMPFGAGSRNCVGQKFAMLEMKVVISKLLRSYELLPVEGFEFKLVPQIVQKPINGVKIKLKRREY